MPYDFRGEYYEDEDEEESEEVETCSDDLPAGTPIRLPMLVPVLPDRPARLVSFEQEVVGNDDYCASSLYNAGLSSEYRVWGYGSNQQEFCHVENDSSVDAEIIYSKLRLSHAPTVRKLQEGFSVIQEGLREGEIALDRHCGFHIHVGIGYDAETRTPCYSSQNVQSLYHLWNHLEDAIYRLGSANWQKHRTEGSYHNYSPATRKGLQRASDIGYAAEGERYALNLSNFLYSRGSCNCGAFTFGAWGECVCTLNKPTVEFRVFNGTANMRKVRAYAALCLALVEYAAEHVVTNITHPPHGWNGTGSMNPFESEAAMRFILRELPFTEAEREDIRYCAERSSLQTVVSNIRRAKGYKAALAA